MTRGQHQQDTGVTGPSAAAPAGPAGRAGGAAPGPTAGAAAGPYALTPVGRVESPLTDRASAPRQGDEGAPDAWLAFDAAYRPALRDLAPGDDVIVLTWLDRADRGRLTVHPRGDAARAEQGVFSTRSPDRPNPIGLHRVRILAVEAEGTRLRVRDMEALDGTPVLDVKPVLGGIEER